MKKYNFYLGSISILLSLLPIILLHDMSIIYEHLTEIISSLDSLMFITILLTSFGITDQRCMSIKKGITGGQTRKDFFTVPILCIIFLLEIVIFYLVDPTFVKENFSIFTGAIGSIIFAYVIYIVFVGTYPVVKTSKVKEKK